MGIKRSVAIKKFLEHSTHRDLANQYNADMEVQVNVAQDGGERKDSQNDAGVRAFLWTDGMQTWGSFRMPKKAMSEPEDNDFDINFELDKHVEAIGMTGWNWRKRVSQWVAYDFDAITGHSDKHAQKLSDAQLEAVKDAAKAIPWVTVRKSTGGKGLHLYVYLKDIPTSNHTEHAALARAILGMMSAITGFDFASSVDICGQNIWVWARKMTGTDGLTLLKEGDILVDVPPNWHDHIKVTASKGKLRNLPQFIPDQEMSLFEELAGQRQKVPLDAEHRKVIDYLGEHKCQWWFDTDHHMLVCCSYDLLQAHRKLSLKGPFDTVSTAKDGGLHNCYAFPMRHGAWVVRRYSKGVSEKPNWDQDTHGYTRCYFNRDPDLSIAARAKEGLELEKGGFEFKEAKIAIEAGAMLGASIDLPQSLHHRTAVLKAHKDGRLVAKVKRETSDQPLPGWREEKDQWVKIYNVAVASYTDVESRNFDELIRHVVSQSEEDVGWFIKGEGGDWIQEPLPHVKSAMQSTGIPFKQISEILGAAILKPWKIVNLPFQPEYPGDRRWNRRAAQLRFTPSPEANPNSFPHWSKIFKHCGKGFDHGVSQHPWCQQHGILNGHDYLLYWFACLFKYPKKPLPYIFLFGSQNCGKSSLHECAGLLFDRKIGYVRADAALTSSSGFNGELESAVLCIVEETDLSKQSGVAYNRIKDWVTSPDILIHPKGQTPRTAPNTCHIIQVDNDKKACPIFKGDTRISMAYVEEFAPGQEIQRDTLRTLLEKEAPDFLGYIMSLEIPESGKRLAMPVIETQDKIDAAKDNMGPLEEFIDTFVKKIPGECIKLGTFYQKFKDWLDPAETENWTKQKMTKSLPPDIPKGRYKGGDWFLGNIAWEPLPEGTERKGKLAVKGETLVHEGT